MCVLQRKRLRKVNLPSIHGTSVARVARASYHQVHKTEPRSDLHKGDAPNYVA
jgi:hypothetical protein